MTRDITGERFGKLTVIERIENDKQGRRRWLCRCDCGNEVTVLECNLRNDHTTSCGCNRSPDIAGKRFGKLTVLSRSKKRGPRGARTVALWRCRCDCGAIVYKPKDSLTNPELSMCAECALHYGVKMAREAAGYVGGTQLSRITNIKETAANTSGCRGVYYEKTSNKWRARLRFKGKLISLGSFNSFEDAVEARKKGEELYFGEFVENVLNAAR